MPKLHFTSNLRRHVDSPTVDVTGVTVREVLNQAFTQNPRLGTYVLDDQGHVRKHMRILVDGRAITDLEKQTDAVHAASEVWVMQALSGG